MKQENATKVRSLGKPPEKLTVAQLNVLIAALKRREDKTIPKMNAILLAKLVKSKERDILTADEEFIMMEEEAESTASIAASEEEEEKDN